MVSNLKGVGNSPFSAIFLLFSLMRVLIVGFGKFLIIFRDKYTLRHEESFLMNLEDVLVLDLRYKFN